ncbi:hypothetical protein GCM10025792_31200 [Pseudonocardia tropica]
MARQLVRDLARRRRRAAEHGAACDGPLERHHDAAALYATDRKNHDRILDALGGWMLAAGGPDDEDPDDGPAAGTAVLR